MGDYGREVVDSRELPVSTGQQDSGSPRRGFRFTADKTFETTVMHTLLEGGLVDVWEVPLLGHLVALAGQACKEVAMTADAAPTQPDSRFTERLRSMQGQFTCAEANLGSAANSMPLIVMAISENLLSWPAYAEHYSKFEESLQGETSQGHFNPGVQAASAKLPLQQLAWLLSDQPCRLMICGKGPAGAIAQHAAMTVQQMLQLPMSDQASCKLPERVLCITFGAPPSSLYSPDGANTESDMVSAKPVVPQLIWNFLLANAASNVRETAENAIRQRSPLADIMPAVLTTRPSNIASASAWFSAVTLLQQVASRRSTDEEDLKESIDKVLAAGVVQYPEYMGLTWFLVSNGESIVSARLGRVMDIGKFAFSGLSREPFKEYFLAVDRLGAATLRAPPQQSSGVLKPFKLENLVKGFFKPLTGVAPSASNIRLAVTPMVGCHITVQGVGVQWICDKAVQVEMTGGEYGMLRFELGTPKVDPIKAHSGTPDEGLLGDNPSTGPEYSLIVKGKVLAENFVPMPPEADAPVDVFLHLTTHFGKQRVFLQKELPEQDAQGLQTRLASGSIENQLQRAVLWAASCLVSGDMSSHQAGLDILSIMDTLESWCRTCPEGLDAGFNNRASRTFSETAWHSKSIKALVEACNEAAAGRPANMFSELDRVGKSINDNTRSIAAVLAAPVVLEYVRDYQTIAVGILILLGCAAASVVLPPVGYALASGEAAALFGGVAAFATSIKVTYGISQGVWAWFCQMYRYNRAYQTKLEQLIGALAPIHKPQQDVAMLEKIVVAICQSEIGNGSPFGSLIQGPNRSDALPAVLPPWRPQELADQRDHLYMLNGRRPTVSCKQVLSTQLNQICAMAQLRNRVNQSCLLGCVGGINAGKTSLVRALLGLPQELDGHRRERATRCAAASPMPVPGSQGLQIIQASPLLVDTPGMFDADSTLADCAVRYLGSMALYIVVLPALDSARLDGTMLERIAQIAIQGKPTLICFNQFSRFLDLWANTEEADKACADILQSVVDVIPVAKDFVQVWLTEFRYFDEHAAQCKARNIKSVENIRQWICSSAQKCGFDIPDGAA